ncbi:MAG: SagB/ThcOx family dehydrogenase [Deltaproteobacteria bacterium]|nr:SagB/ThcOx family dehydrogenase [Deltaproteobacteria bacterium]MBW2085456.1 SagB/ThcOx family dehydrogenase [Deltaproteobacteria bacterium]
MSELNSAAEYHDRTRYTRDRMSGSGLDWSNQPRTTKAYPGAETVPLPRELTLPRIEVSRALLGRLKRSPEPLNLSVLAELLYMAYGFTTQFDYGTQVFQYRSAPSAGALYPTEIYLAARGVDGLADGLYHYSLNDFSLALLRPGPPPAKIPAPSLILSSIFFRSAWKYRERGFRYCLLDTGHVAENLMLISPTLGLEPQLETDFDDDPVNRYLDLDPTLERALCLIRLGSPISSSSAAASSPEEAGSVPGLPQAEPLAPREETFDLITAVSQLTSAHLTRKQPLSLERPAGLAVSLPKLAWDEFTGPTLVEALQKRRSRRNFRPSDLEKESLARVLDMVAAPDPGTLINLGLAVSSIQDLPDGYYLFRPETHDLKQHKGGFLSLAISSDAFHQDWLSRASLILVLTAPLAELEGSLGPRALRLAYLAAGRLGQRAYLAAEYMGWGCCGVGAFYDADLHQTLSLPQGEEILYLVALGSIKKRTHGGRPEKA